MIGGSPDFWTSLSIEELARIQGVKPLSNVESLFGTWPGEVDDGFEEAVLALRRGAGTEKHRDSRVAEKLTIEYDREGDILYIGKRGPYPEQETEELGDDIIARLNPETREVENIEILFFSTRLLRSNSLELPITADLRLAAVR